MKIKNVNLIKGLEEFPSHSPMDHPGEIGIVGYEAEDPSACPICARSPWQRIPELMLCKLRGARKSISMCSHTCPQGNPYLEFFSRLSC